MRSARLPADETAILLCVNGDFPPAGILMLGGVIWMLEVILMLLVSVPELFSQSG